MVNIYSKKLPICMIDLHSLPPLILRARLSNLSMLALNPLCCPVWPWTCNFLASVFQAAKIKDQCLQACLNFYFFIFIFFRKPGNNDLDVSPGGLKYICIHLCYYLILIVQGRMDDVSSHANLFSLMWSLTFTLSLVPGL